MAASSSQVVALKEKKMITLRSFDLQEFKVEEVVAMESETIRRLIEDGCTENGIPVPNVDGKILSKVIEYCKKHARSTSSKSSSSSSYEDDDDKKKEDEDPRTWDTKFIDVDQATLFDLIMAANYLDVKGLLDLTCQKVADMIAGRTPEQIRETFNIKNDFTPEEEEEIRRDNQWAFD